MILNGIRDGMWYSFALEALDQTGNVLGVYHHPGPLTLHPLFAASGASNATVLLFGVNSSARFVRQIVPFETTHHPGCVVLLEPGDIFGQAFPYTENLPEIRDWPDLPKAREYAYLLIPPLSPDLDSRVSAINTHDAGTNNPGYTAIISDGRFVILDEDLRPLKCTVGRDSPAAGLLAAERAANTPYLYLRRGVAERIRVPTEL
ncbi:MAG: hypothetical protein IPH48_15255 [bacterium]|nr:hypothetical protein [bacterium]